MTAELLKFDVIIILAAIGGLGLFLWAMIVFSTQHIISAIKDKHDTKSNS